MGLSFRTGLAVLVTSVAIAACSDSPTNPDDSPLAGLAAVEHDGADEATTSGNPGFFRGTVVGPWDFGSGEDSTVAAPRLAGVVVTIYETESSDVEEPVVGAVKGTVTTGVDGKFTLPTLPAGEYVVTFVPPADSPYRGVYSAGPLDDTSSGYPWWVVLPKK